MEEPKKSREQILQEAACIARKVVELTVPKNMNELAEMLGETPQERERRDNERRAAILKAINSEPEPLTGLA